MGNGLVDTIIKRTVDYKQYVQKTAIDYMKEQHPSDKTDLSDVQKAVLAMHESGVKVDQIIKMLQKYWHLTLDEANSVIHSFDR